MVHKWIRLPEKIIVLTYSVQFQEETQPSLERKQGIYLSLYKTSFPPVHASMVGLLFIL